MIVPQIYDNNFILVKFFLHFFKKNSKWIILIILFLTNTKGFKQSAIADEIGVDRTAFNHAVSGRRITKCSEYIIRMQSRYSDVLIGMGVDTKPQEAISQKNAWDIVIENQKIIIESQNEILELLKKKDSK